MIANNRLSDLHSINISRITGEKINDASFLKILTNAKTGIENLEIKLSERIKTICEGLK